MTMKFLITLFILAVCTRTVQSTNRKTQRNFIRSMKSVVGRICSDITTMKDKIMDLETVLQEKVRDIEVENDGLKVKVSDLEMKVSDLEQIVNQTGKVAKRKLH